MYLSRLGRKMTLNIDRFKGHEPLINYPWCNDIERLLIWLSKQDSYTKAFCFDIMMSAAYLDATSGLEKNIEACNNAPDDYNAHLGFINLCSPCFCNVNQWVYQKATKPKSGLLGKLSSEVILKFIEGLYTELEKVTVVGGTEIVDAILTHRNGMTIFAEVKSAPLLTFPFIFKVHHSCINGEHQPLTITNSQLRDCYSAIYLHNNHYIELGKVGEKSWPFKPLVDFLINPLNTTKIYAYIEIWVQAKIAYETKDRNKKMYFLANACGNPPKIAIERDGWPKSSTISDSKTSAGMDRTDDIKKSVYQSLKIGNFIKNNPEWKTAIISNLPAYRHGNQYLEPFIDMYWGLEENLCEIAGKQALLLDDLRRVFDFIITLDESVLRNIQL